jgi:hypothetical protein
MICETCCGGIGFTYGAIVENFPAIEIFGRTLTLSPLLVRESWRSVVLENTDET